MSRHIDALERPPCLIYTQMRAYDDWMESLYVIKQELLPPGPRANPKRRLLPSVSHAESFLGERLSHLHFSLQFLTDYEQHE